MGKTVKLLSLICSAGILFISQNAWADSQNLVKNGTFANGMKSWQFQTKDSAATADVTDGTLKITRNKAKIFSRIYQDVNVTQGKYKLSFRVKPHANARYKAWLNLGAKNKWLSKTILFFQKKPSSEWLDVHNVIEIPADVDKIRINIVITGANTYALFDDISLQRISTIAVSDNSGKINLDGKLNEPFWKNSTEFTGFRLLGKPLVNADVQTKVFMSINNNILYIGAQMIEPNIKNMRTNIKKDSLGVFSDDCIEFFFSPDKKSYIHFLVNPLGYKAVKMYSRNAFNLSWHSEIKRDYTGQWQVASQINKSSWTVELAIPLTDLYRELSVSKSTFYANICRHRPNGKNPHSSWVGLTGKSFHALEQMLPVKLKKFSNKKSAKSDKKIALAFKQRLTIPKLLVAGKPLRLTEKSGEFMLPGNLKFEDKNCPIDASVKKLIKNGVCLNKGKTIKIYCDIWSKSQIPVKVTTQEKNKLKSPEAFLIKVGKNSINVSGRTKQGVLRGLATLGMLTSHAKNQGFVAIPCMELLDAPGLKFRGYHITAQTLTELKQQVDLLFLLRFNAVMFGTSCYSGPTKFPFSTHPKISKHRTTTKKEWAAFADYIRARGMTPIAIQNTWSRCGYILNTPEYKHLAVRPDLKAGSLHNAHHDRNMCVSNPESEKVLNDLLGELVDTMKLDAVHIGLDELHYDDMNTHPLDKKRNLSKTGYVIETVTKSNNFLKSKGARTFIWADMLEPGMNGKKLEFSGAKLLRKLPQDVVIVYWNYDAKSDFPAVRLFTKAGFKTVVASWDKSGNIAGLIDTVYKAKGLGFLGTVWDDTRPNNIPPELITAISLAAYLTWSPEDCDLKKINFPPAILYQTAAYNYGKEKPPAKNAMNIPTPDKLVAGEALFATIGFPKWAYPSFLTTEIITDRGVRLKPFMKNRKPAALVIKNKGEKRQIKLSGKARFITFLHTVNNQKFSGKMHAMKKYFKGASPGTYILHFRDGSNCKLVLKYRDHITDWNDKMLAKSAEPALFGTVGQMLQVNIPVYTWENPFPEKELSFLEIRPGNRQDMNLIVLGMALDNGIN
jgi:Glycosyl hydrolase family 20, catalytic domain/Carbohydrate binding domain/Carbohydrate family 9 binding domain-like